MTCCDCGKEIPAEEVKYDHQCFIHPGKKHHALPCQ